MAFWEAENSRRIQKRIFIRGNLVLETPAHLGSGDSPEETRIPLVVDPYDGITPLLTGASLAGALRAYLWARENGYQTEEQPGTWTEGLFGSVRLDDETQQGGEQSRLIIDDALGQNSRMEIRSGVSLTPESRTAADQALYAHELWGAGTTFPLCIELLLYEGDGAEYAQALAAALNGLCDGSIRLGARKQRGFGQVNVGWWQVETFNLCRPQDLMAWLRRVQAPDTREDASIFNALEMSPEWIDRREMLELEAEFVLDGSLLIRTGDSHLMTHLTSHRSGGEMAIVSGTSIAGALRARMHKIATTLRGADAANDMINELFGQVGKRSDDAQSSRLRVEETAVTRDGSALANEQIGLEQSRVAIDRFTGGALDTALFRQQPVFGGQDTHICLRLSLINPCEAEIGLLLLALKDLWTSDLPLGGESSVGRGRLKGQWAFLSHPTGQWELSADPRGLQIKGEVRQLETFVRTLVERVSRCRNISMTIFVLRSLL